MTSQAWRFSIWRCCRELDRCLREAVHDEAPKHEDIMKSDAEDGVGGDDALDSARYTLQHAKDLTAEVPRAYWVAERVTTVISAHTRATGEIITDPNRLIQVQRNQEALYAKQHKPRGGQLTLPRAGSSRHWSTATK